ncbi:Fur family transcriptional regulator [Corynebacterium choanae]|uniref:Zinc uptake regulation protein n=1 Tax=Corynebacterium choanae TaxID=1862358 RepID=A0A3G6JD24_9CORY|nr:Fur family transcriptional regulator [Corynebacterium choanae]AZA14054.1 Zinc uptake regulation protein [Corynebacterium choanae]
MAAANDKHIPKLGVRSTRQRTAVVEVLRDIDNFASAKQIYAVLHERGESVGLTTVYRTLQSLADINAVDVLHMASGESLYRSCDTDHHHHHLVCVACGLTHEIAGGPVEKWAAREAKGFGFQVTGHTAEVFGVCATCQNDPTATPTIDAPTDS